MAITQNATHDHRQDLLRWYDQNKRDLPWRHTSDPYAIWVSEIMLQQTRVETVLPYYEKFLGRFPTVEAVAQAEVEELLGAWSGLGYYRRARLLHQAARQLAAAGKALPAGIKELRELAGVGAYTAAAIGSIAFGLVEPAIDGNSERVLARYLGLAADPKRGEGRERVAVTARNLLDKRRPGDSNQALMELGATVCRPRAPRCSGCPLEPSCQARALGNPEAFPAARARVSPTRVHRRVAVVQREGRVLLFRRSATSGQLAGMWELPWVERLEGVLPEAQYEDRYGGCWRIGQGLGSVRHSITRRAFEIEVLAARLGEADAIAEGPEAGWFTARDLEGLPKSSLVTKVLAVATRSGAGR